MRFFKDESDSEQNQNSATRAFQVGGVLVLLVIILSLLPFSIPIPDSTLVLFSVGVTFLLYALVVLGLNLQYGYAGIINFGPVAFFAVGGYAAAIVSAEGSFQGLSLGFPWPVGLVAAIISPTILGVIVGISTLRLRDDFLAIATLAVAETTHNILTNFEYPFGASIGIGSIPTPIASLVSSSNLQLFTTFIVFAAVLSFVYVGFERLSGGAYGRVLRAIRADDQVAQSLGKNAFSYKLQVFLIGAAVAGLAGGLFAFYTGAVAPGFFTLNVTVLLWIGMLTGGPGNHRGVLVGLGIILGLRLLTRFGEELIPVTQSQFGSIRLMVIGALLIAVIYYRPAGLFGSAEELGVDR